MCVCVFKLVSASVWQAKLFWEFNVSIQTCVFVWGVCGKWGVKVCVCACVWRCVLVCKWLKWRQKKCVMWKWWLLIEKTKVWKSNVMLSEQLIPPTSSSSYPPLTPRSLCPITAHTPPPLLYPNYPTRPRQPPSLPSSFALFPFHSFILKPLYSSCSWIFPSFFIISALPPSSSFS